MTNTNEQALPASAAAELAALTRRVLLRDVGFVSVESQQNDRDDFREVAVWQMARIVREAFEAGRASK